MDFPSRRKRVLTTLMKRGVDSCLIEAPADLLYLTGLSLSSGTLWLSPDRSILFVDGRYRERAEQCGMVVEPASLARMGACLSQRSRVGFDAASTSYARYTQCKEAFAGIELIPLQEPCREVRWTKDAEEIAQMEQSGRVVADAVDHLKEHLRPGMSERQARRIFEEAAYDRGAEEIAFPSIIAFGAHTSMPHYRAGAGVLAENDVALIDVGVKIGGYASDMTRTWLFGSPSPEIKKIFTLVREAYTLAVALCQPGRRIGDLDQAVRRHFAAQELEGRFLHSLGHGIGVEVHEPPRLRHDSVDADLRLEEGMVITIEPGLYLEGIGGVRWEDTLLITEQGTKALTMGSAR